MIENLLSRKGFKITCDQCGQSEIFEMGPVNNFKEFISKAKAKGWLSCQTTGGWEHRCPKCHKEGDEIPF